MLKEPTAYQHELDLTDKVPDASTISQNRRRRFADTHVTPANVHDSQPYLARLDRQSERFNLNPYAVGLDAGYFAPTVCKGLEDRLIAPVTVSITRIRIYARAARAATDAERNAVDPEEGEADWNAATATIPLPKKKI